ncbi:tetratricopeptide repeat protein [Algibacter pectinivorans]|uniref:Tetratricopeptide repeat-containing protein n=1 Tax=Algibacter pectinivorans TaxID=870482 RepID=A0A1I1PYA1_9FLAO|nr:tetratricopeptide repeat protein [Algibacter pectinivorans]SFD14876.1 Tetratricopeptide repeat-containing protein [Algibacter pectinivorans]
MKTKITLLLAFLFIGLNNGFSQQDEECLTKLSIFHEYVKAKNYDAAYEPWMAVRNKCPQFNNAIYVDGEKILEDKIDKASGADKVAFINDLLKLWEQKAEHFASKTPKGEYAAQAAQLMYDNKDVLGKSTEDLYNAFDAAYQLDKATFTNPKSLYTYFSLMVDLYDAGKKPAADLFNKYDDVVDKVEEEVKNFSEKLNKLIEKEDAGTTLTKKEGKYKRYYESYLKNYDLISGNIDAKLGIRANCENLIPLYNKDYEVYRTDPIWLKRAVSRMYYKECTDDPLYEKLVKSYDEIDPSADTKYFVGTIMFKKGKENEAISYFEQSFDLENDTFKKAKLANRIGLILKRKGRYGQARGYFRKALKLNPSNGRPYLSIAAMYAASANNCGDTNFDKRAVYWLAANEAQRAANVDPTLSKAASQSVANYRAKAPQKSEIFSSGRAGQTIKIGCWIGSSVTVPSI